jgi:hypothetical protein
LPGCKRWEGALVSRFQKEFGVQTPGLGVFGASVDRWQKLICLAAGDGSTVVAFDKDSGKELWRALTSKEPGYSSPVIFESGGKTQLIIWHPEAANSLESRDRHGLLDGAFQSANQGMTIATPRKMDDKLLFTSFYQRISNDAIQCRQTRGEIHLAHGENERKGKPRI